MRKLRFQWLLFVFLLKITCFSCEAPQKRKDLGLSFKSEFAEAKTDFPDSLVDHFPRKIAFPANYINELGSDERNVSLQLNLEYSNPEIDSIENYLLENSIAKYSAGDSCLLVVNRFVRRTEWGVNNSYKSSMERPASCRNDYLPVLNFWRNEVETSETSSRLPLDYTIYVIKAQPGIFWENLSSKSGRYMPKYWKNGYSKGVAVNESGGTVIYWTAIW